LRHFTPSPSSASTEQNTTKIITQHFKCRAITQTLFVNSERVETSSTLTLWTASWYKDKTQTNKAAADGDKPLRTTKGQKGTKMENIRALRHEHCSVGDIGSLQTEKWQMAMRTETEIIKMVSSRAGDRAYFLKVYIYGVSRQTLHCELNR